MTTSLEKPINRLTGFRYNGRAVVAHLSDTGVALREKGRRQLYYISWAQVWIEAVRNLAREQEAAKRANKKLLKEIRGR